MIARYLKAFLLTITSFGTGIFGGMLVANAAQTPEIDPYDGFYTFSLNLHRIQNDYINEVPTTDLIYHAITGMMSALDEHSTYFPPEEYAKLQQRTGLNEWSVGMGIQVNKEKVITDITPNSPASLAGLIIGDQFLEINGNSLQDWTLHQIHSALDVEKGSLIDIVITRALTPIEIKLVADEVADINHKIETLPDDVVYVSMKRFTGDSSTNMLSDLRQTLRDHANVQGIVLDLRNNPGGNVREGIRIADAFLANGPISTIRYRQEKDTQVYRATADPNDILTQKIAILINRNSASAAELFAGALQENQRAIVIGEKSFGKGSVQKMYHSENEALKLTVGTFTAGEHAVSKENPITPDILIAQPHIDPKEALASLITNSSASNEQQQEMQRYLNQLSGVQTPVAFSLHNSLEERLRLDPVLQRAWKEVQ